MAAAFFAAELKVVDVHFRREKHSFSLSEFPAVIGFFLLSPGDYFMAMLLGTGAALLVHGQAPLKLAFNLSNFAFTAAAALSVFYLLQSTHGVPDPVDWVAAFAATTCAAVLSAFTIATAISMSGGAPQYEKLPEMIQFGGLVAIANTSLALLAVSVLWLDPLLLALLVVPLLTVFLAYRAYVSEREKHERLELLYQSSRILQHSPELDSALAALLEHAREMFRAERAEVLLWPRDETVEEGLLTVCEHDREPLMMVPRPLADADRLHRRVAHERRAFLHISPDRGDPEIRNAMAAPLLGEAGLIGSMVVANRLTEGTTFSDDDLRLLETLANQAAVALENGQLEQSLAELSRLKEQLRFQAYHDPLTGLANRSLFAEQVNGAIEHPTADRVPVVLFLDLDNFKDVNDALGHPAGDRLLTAVADRVQSCIRAGDVAARLGGDEFAILLLDEPELGAAVTVATRLIAAFAVTFPINGQDLKVSASIGIAASLEHGRPGRRPAAQRRRRDVHGQAGRQEPVRGVRAHDARGDRRPPRDVDRAVARASTTARSTSSTSPCCPSRPGVTLGVEALARWHHPTRGFVEPDEFIPLAEESGAILALGRAVLFEACREAAPWRSGIGDGISLTVNLSAAQLAQETFVDELVDVLRATGLPGHAPGPRDDRDRDVRRHPDDHRAPVGAARPRASGSPSTTSAPATRRWATCAGSRSTS